MFPCFKVAVYQITSGTNIKLNFVVLSKMFGLELLVLVAILSWEGDSAGTSDGVAAI